MRLSAPEYISFMKSRGLFSETPAVPEWNTRFWDMYFGLYKTYIGDPAAIECVVSENGAAFYRDPLAGREDYNWALLGPVSHPPVPFTAAALAAMAGEIAAAFADDAQALIQTDTFAFQNDAVPGSLHFIIANSPQAAILHDFAAYAESLRPERRKQLRRLYRTYNDDPAFRFTLSLDGPTHAELDFIIAQTQARWGEDASYALPQALWSAAAAMVLPPSARFMRIYAGDRLVFFNSYLLRGDTIISQSTTRDEDNFFSGLGTMVDFKTIEILCGSDIRFLDPTCRTCLEDTESIGVAKREVVNRDRKRPMLRIGADRLEGQPCYDPVSGWIAAPDAAIIGRGV